MALGTFLALAAYLVVDGHWFTFDARQPLEYYPTLGVLFASGASADECTGTAAGGGAPIGDNALQFGQGFAQSLQLTGPITIHRIGDRLRVDTATADASTQCDGEVPEPVFVSSFELR